MKPSWFYERVSQSTFWQLQINTPDGYAFCWYWGATDGSDWLEFPILTLGLDGVE